MHVPTVNALPLLYSYRRCPYAMRARMALLQAGRDFQALEVDLRDKPAALLALSPKGTVPVLHLPDGRVLEESWDIMAWALAPDDPDGWWRLAQSPENLDLLHRNDGDFKHYLDRYKYPDRYPEDERSRDALRAHAVAALLVPLEARLHSQPIWAAPRHALPTWRYFHSCVSSRAWIRTGLPNRTCLPFKRGWLHGWAAACSRPAWPGCRPSLPYAFPHCRLERCAGSNTCAGNLAEAAYALQADRSCRDRLDTRKTGR